MPLLTLHPADTTVTEGSSTQFTISSPNAYNYAWLESQDNGVSWLTLEENEIYSGTTTGTLFINPVSLSMNQNLYKCLVSRGNCNTYSGNARLTVDELTSTDAAIPGSMRLKIYPDPIPAGSPAILHFTLNEPASLYLSIYNLNGQQIENNAYPGLSAGDHNITLHSSTWNKDLYFFRVEAITPTSKSTQSMKIIKN
jgi:hypothetical protein